ncbi:HalOD1 output domain-containing protein [Natrinema pallidum]|uniref:HalOD1 output domain-containing protein n=1 Tax=Natrinema pallidum TaxID=69527 RepID=UPI00373AE64B
MYFNLTSKDIWLEYMTANKPPSNDSAIICTEQLESESIIETIVRVIADQKNVSDMSLAPIYDQIDSNALVRILDHAEEHECKVKVDFCFEGYRVVVSQDGTVCVM